MMIAEYLAMDLTPNDAMAIAQHTEDLSLLKEFFISDNEYFRLGAIFNTRATPEDIFWRLRDSDAKVSMYAAGSHKITAETIRKYAFGFADNPNIICGFVWNVNCPEDMLDMFLSSPYTSVQEAIEEKKKASK